MRGPSSRQAPPASPSTASSRKVRFTCVGQGVRQGWGETPPQPPPSPPLTSAMTLSGPGPGGVYRIFPMKRGLIPRQKICERGLDSRLRTSSRQKGPGGGRAEPLPQAPRRLPGSLGGAVSSKPLAELPPPPQPSPLTAGAVRGGGSPLRAVAVQEGFDVVVLVPVEGGDPKPPALGVPTGDARQGPEGARAGGAGVGGHQRPELPPQLGEAGHGGDLGRAGWGVGLQGTGTPRDTAGSGALLQCGGGGGGT